MMLVAIVCFAFSPHIAHAQTSATPPASGSSGKAAPGWKPAPEPEHKLANEIPDTTLLLQVGTEKVTVREYIRRFYSSYPEQRPDTDSLGRLQFMQTLENGMVLARVARDRNRPLDFAERASMREHTDRVLSNVLYKRSVLDSVVVTDADLRELHSMLSTEIRLREMAFRNRALAEQVRDLLVAKKMTWESAYKQYNQLASKSADGDAGWVKRTTGDPIMAEQVFRLQKGEISNPWQDSNGVHLVQCTDTRVVTPPPFGVVAPRLREMMRAPRMGDRTETISRLLRDRIEMVYDTANVVWTANQFQETMKISSTGGAPVISLGAQMPRFDLADTSKVLARFKGGRFTLAQFVEAYRSVNPVARPAVNTPDRLRQQIDAVVLEPQRALLAAERGYAKDPLAVEWIEKRREELMVDRLFQDSVQNYVSVSESDARRFYEQHRAQYITYPKVRYAVMAFSTQGAADSVVAQLKAGARLDQFVRADSIARRPRRGSIREMRANEEGQTFHTQLFQDLKPGELLLNGPDEKGDYLVLQSLDFDPGHQLSFEEAYSMVDSALQNQRADELLDAFLARQRKKIPILRRDDLLQRFTLRDPSLSASQN